jgi:hypothetical protein
LDTALGESFSGTVPESSVAGNTSTGSAGFGLMNGLRIGVLTGLTVRQQLSAE